ncbi:hypothetical protein PISMIDRAFT_20325 [Pisolithus microcarpus 441]|uniref:Uncharacterized protein n=1 Tax=Pisolithus microcarpus 441 TaxID=765257 RepID=A0A0C9Y052_9AGAM|nr:hypothetical protein BKA83DRAFT_20325 [Pisolithus microcarpus]KIK10516.1 hypothetical protein PISMIDRAFT_20325 [Pisolithus microcarpus 441]
MAGMTKGRNVYDVSKVVCQGHDLCYAEDEVIRRFLDSHSTRTMLGAESPRNFSLFLAQSDETSFLI